MVYRYFKTFFFYIFSRKRFKTFDQNDTYQFISSSENKIQQNDEVPEEEDEVEEGEEEDSDNETTNDSQSELSETNYDSKKSHDSTVESSFETEIANNKPTTANSIEKQQIETFNNNNSTSNNKKRSFNVDALLAPDPEEEIDHIESVSNVKRLKLNEKPNLIEIESKIFSPQTRYPIYPEINPNSNSNLTSLMPILPNNFLEENFLVQQQQNFTKNPSNEYKLNHISPNLTQTKSNNDKFSLHNKMPKSPNPNNNRGNLSKQNIYDQNSPFSKVDSNNLDVEKWKQTFSKIMARSYKNNNNSSANNSCTSSSNLINNISPNKK